VRVHFQRSTVEDDALVVHYRVDRSTIVSRISLGIGDPYLRVDTAVLWEERKTLLRLEHWLAIEAPGATIGVPHGTTLRYAQGTPQADAEKFELPGQRFARVDGPAGGFAVLAGEGYGWSVRALKRGGIGLGLSLLRGTTSPDPDADRGEHRFTHALLPLAAGQGIGEVEHIWRWFAYPQRVRLFTCDDPAIVVVACKPADDGDGAIVRVRECEGAARTMRLRCGGRIRQVEANDGCERRLEREASIDDYAIVASLEPYELRTFRVRF
jgi:alpha-mannosidase